MKYTQLTFAFTLIIIAGCTTDPKYLPSVSGAADGTGSSGSNGSNGTNGVNGTNGKSTLAKVVAVGPGVGGCVNGGQELQLGQDADANGTLDAAEVTTTQTICNGVAGAAGPPGGEAGTFHGAQYVGSMTAPPGPTGGFSINTEGGDGQVSAANGGNGGHVRLEITQNTLGGHVKVFGTGNATNETMMPAAPTVPMPIGTQEMLVASAVTITAKTSAVALGGGTPNSPTTFFTINDDAYPGRVYFKSAGALVQVSDIRITAAGILVVEANTATNTYATLSIPGNIVSDGAINVTANTGTQLAIGCSSYYGSATSSISSFSKHLFLTVANVLQNAGQISTSSFGPAANIVLTSVYGIIHNTALIRANGSGIGVISGAPVTLKAARAIYNSGTINTAGGGTNGGGSGANISLQVQAEPNNAGQGQIRNSGVLDARGAGCSGVSCPAGKGGDISLSAKGGAVTADYIAIASNASLLTRGGDSNNATPGAGGQGGKITITSDDLDADASLGNIVTMAGSIYLSGNMTTSGGDGNPGNSGGDVTITLSPRIAFGQEIVLLGYEYYDGSLLYHQGINTSGGNGGATSAVGGNAGNITMKNTGAHGGGVINTAALLALGGNSAGQSGNGGKLLMSSASGTSAADVGAGQVVINSGKITLSGGVGSGANGAGGYGGEFKLIGAAKVESHLSSFIASPWGILASDGGGAKMPGNGAPLGNASTLASGAGPVINDGSITIAGGTTTGAGLAFSASPGQSVVLVGTVVTNSGDITSDGGDNSTAGGNGNDGGNITLLSTSGVTTNTGLLRAAAGTTSPNRVTSDGVVNIDGNNVLP